MKNTILMFITGMSFGSIIIGAAYFKYDAKVALTMLALGCTWLALFVYANCRKSKNTTDK